MCLLLAFGSVLCFSPYSHSEDLPTPLCNEWIANAELYLAMHPKYVRGGVDPRYGVNCSGLAYATAPQDLKKKHLLMNLRRSTADRMQQGLDGWVGRAISLFEAHKSDLVFIKGHVALTAYDPKAGLYVVIHSTVSRGVVKEPMPGWMLRKEPTVKRLVIHE